MAQVKLIDYWAPWCIDPQTPILTENGYVVASQIQLGDNLVTIEPETKMQRISEVTRIKTFKSVPSHKMILETGKILIGDSNHLVLTDKGFREMRKLQKGDRVLVNLTQKEELLWEYISAIEEVKKRDVVGITVGNPHTLITNGIVSHNCGPCRMMAPVLEEIKKERPNLVVEEINVDEHPEETQQASVLGIPTYVILKDDKEVGRKVGVTSKSELLKLIDEN